jgi:peptidoglycan-associated lipoprotein
MKLVKKLLALTLIAGLVFALSGCATTKKAGEGDGTAVGAGATLELNGDSDSNKAGDLKTIHFPFDSNTLTEAEKTILKANAEFMKKNEKVRVQIEGHCDERGSIQYNLALGERRAKATKDYLAGLGIAASRVTVISYGKERPVEFGHDDTSWSKNRRANFLVIEK